MQKILFPHRAESHLPFLRLVRESGSWERQGLDVDFEYKLSKAEAHKAIVNGEIEFVSGNHLKPYADRVRGDRWCYVGQTVNIGDYHMVVRPESGIKRLADLKGKRVVKGHHHPHLCVWLLLKRNGLDPDQDVTLSMGSDNKAEWEMLRDGEADAIFVLPPDNVLMRRANFQVIEVPPLPMIHQVTLSTYFPFVQAHPDICLRFLQGLRDGIRYIKGNREAALKILMNQCSDQGLSDPELAQVTYQWMVNTLEDNLYPTMSAIEAAYTIAAHDEPEALQVNPLVLWDLHFLRELSDM